MTVVPSTARRVAPILLVALVTRLLVLAGYEGGIVDGVDRVLVARDWLERARPLLELVGTQAWPDGNYFLPAVPLALGGDPFWSVRIVYALVGVSNVLALYLLARSLVTERAAWTAAALLALNPYHMLLSVQMGSAEIPYVTCVVLGLWAAWRVRDEVRIGRVLAVAACFVAASWFRYEALLWAALSGLAMLFPSHASRPAWGDRRRLGAVALVGGLTAIYPVVLVLRWAAVHGDPSYFGSIWQINQGQFYETGHNANWPDYIYRPFAGTFWVTSAFVVLTPVVAAFGFVGLIRAARRPATAPFVIIYVLFSAVLAYESLRTPPLGLEYRYGMVLHALLLPFVVDGVAAIARRWPGLTPRRAAGAIVGSVVLFYAGYTLAAWQRPGVLARRLGLLSPVQRGQYAGRAVLRWVDQQPGPPARVIVTPCANSAYLPAAEHRRVARGELRILTAYKDEWRVYDRREYAAAFPEMVSAGTYVVFPRECDGIGFRDGVASDPFHPPMRPRAFTRGGITFTPAVSLRGWDVFTMSRAAGSPIGGA